MATIERKPLPPANSTAIAITEADRAEMMARANAVIDHYLNGPGSYWDAGPRKPLVSDNTFREGDSTLTDLKRFKDSVIASKQYADDPNSIMDSIIDLIDRKMGELGEAAGSNEGIKDDIERRPPDTYDPIDDPRVISPRALNNSPLLISLPAGGDQPAPPPQASPISEISGSRPVRILGRRVVNPSLPLAFDASEEAAPDVGEMVAGGADAQRIRFLSGRVPHGEVGSVSSGLSGVPNWPVPLSQSERHLGLLTGERMPQWPLESQSSNGPLPWLFRYLNQANGT